MSAIERMDPARGLDTTEPRLAAALDGLGETDRELIMLSAWVSRRGRAQPTPVQSP